MHADVEQSLALINEENLLEHIKILASDGFAGRKPGSPGEGVTLEYLVAQCRALGLFPAGDNGSFLQKVEVIGISSLPQLIFEGANQQLIEPLFPDQFVAMSRLIQPQINVDSEMVFVGYGVQAPEYDWDDYKGLDVRGKTLLMLIGDPRQLDAQDPAKLDANFFRGHALTYYGRWTYKFEIAAQLGAEAVFLIHDNERAGYSFDVVKASWSGENFALPSQEKKVSVEGWIAQNIARQILNLENLDYDFLVEGASKRDFRPVCLKVKANIGIANSYRQFDSANVVAALHLPSPARREGIIYSAHWDHFGSTESGEVFSGAADNASGVAVVLEAARAYGSMAKPEGQSQSQSNSLNPYDSRNVFFLLTTLEEYGLLGAQHYVANPAIPLDDTLAVFNVDIMNLWGRTSEVVSIALGHSSLDSDLAHCAAWQNRSVVADPEPDKGYFYRSDHLEFIRRGVPAIFFLQPGSKFIDKPPDFGEKMRLQYLRDDYHKVSDKVKPNWDLAGIVEDTQLLVMTGLRVLQAAGRPEWNVASEFNQKRILD